MSSLRHDRNMTLDNNYLLYILIGTACSFTPSRSLAVPKTKAANPLCKGKDEPHHTLGVVVTVMVASL